MTKSRHAPKSRRSTASDCSVAAKSVNTEATERVNNSRASKNIAVDVENGRSQTDVSGGSARVDNFAKNKVSLQHATTEAVANRPLPSLEVEKCNSKNKTMKGQRNTCGKKVYHCGDVSAVYEGQFKSGKRHGIGTLRWDDGGEYEGEWEDGKPHGRGTMKYSSGDVYAGQFENDKRHGRGTYKWLKGDVYTGNWKDDLKHGMGTRKYAKGDAYHGEWKEGKRHGDGAMRYAKGGLYTGEWRNNEKHGIGSRKYLDGGVYEGKWKDGEKSGKGTYQAGQVK